MSSQVVTNAGPEQSKQHTSKLEKTFPNKKSSQTLFFLLLLQTQNKIVYLLPRHQHQVRDTQTSGPPEAKPRTKAWPGQSQLEWETPSHRPAYSPNHGKSVVQCDPLNPPTQPLGEEDGNLRHHATSPKQGGSSQPPFSLTTSWRTKGIFR